jgi:hypothetical protein
MKNWRTTIWGLIGAVGIVILSEYDPLKDPRWLKYVAVIMNAVGAAGVGLFAKDTNDKSDKITDKPAENKSFSKSVTDFFRKS